MINYTVLDIAGILLATIIFPIVMLTPGYVIGWGFNIFEFRSRRLITRHIIGIVLSNAISPILLFLLYRLTSQNFTLACLLFPAITYFALLVYELWRKSDKVSEHAPIPARYLRTIPIIIGTILLLSIVTLVDIQFQNRLYFSTVSYDLTTRVSVVDAITRTGVPPVNPGYYPGHPSPLTFLYYFWYILGSIVDRLGGNNVSAYQSMIASSAWCGFTLMATLTLYNRLKNDETGEKKYRLPVISGLLLLVGGLDFIPVTMAILQDKLLMGRLPYEGHLESWNTPVMTWGNGLLWVPHHISSALACITAMLLIISSRKSAAKQKSIATVLAGFAFASAVGLSVWIMFTFAIFCMIWSLFTVVKKSLRDMTWQIALAGILALLLASPFIIGLIQSGQNDATQGLLPIGFYVRPFMAIIYFDFLPYAIQSVINFLFLPLNYLFEFGFFLVIAILWIQETREMRRSGNPYHNVEMILVITIVILLSFVHSNVIVINDLGIRGWIPLQIILVIWAVELIGKRIDQSNNSLLPAIKSMPDNKKLGILLNIFFVIGILSTLTDLVAARTWPVMVDLNIVGFPNELSPDTKLGERTFAARQVYDYIREHVPADMIIQNNPVTALDRPGGLYGDHQMAFADRTAYGVSTAEFKRMTEGIGEIFKRRNDSDWIILDQICNDYVIDMIVVNDTDPLWLNMDVLAASRPPIYKNDYYAVFDCGN